MNGWDGMEQWLLLAERTTPNRRKPSGFNRDVPSCVVTYPYILPKKYIDSNPVPRA
jgi:hypothetical protein